MKRGTAMPFSRPLPRGLKKVLDLLESDPSQTLTISELAALGGVAPRTLQKHFRHFLGRTPVQHLHDLRFDRARKELLRAPPGASVTEIAGRCGLGHLGRFATRYRERYGESPSATLRRCQAPRSVPWRLPSGLSAVERPTIAVLPFDLIGPATELAA